MKTTKMNGSGNEDVDAVSILKLIRQAARDQDVSLRQLRVYVFLVTTGKPRAWKKFTQAYIAKHAGIKESFVGSATDGLFSLGYLEQAKYTKPGKGSRYCYRIVTEVQVTAMSEAATRAETGGAA